MNHPLSKYLVCYDVADPKRLRRVHRSVRDWGVPVQRSVFEAELNPTQLAQLMAQLTTLIDATQDNIIVYRLGSHYECLGLGLSVPTEDVLFV